ERLARRVRDSVAATIELVKQPLAVLDQALRVHGTNAAFRQLLELPVAGIEGRALEDLADGRWDVHALRVRLERAGRDEERFDGVELAAGPADKGSQKLLVSGR